MNRDLLAACKLARTAGALAYRYFVAWHGTPTGQEPPREGGALPVEWKDGDEPVTAADRAVSELCVDELHREFPEDAVLSEELPDDGSRLRIARTWLVDPIDGTKDFIAGRTGFAVMLGLLIDGVPSLGVVYQPSGDRLYYAQAGQGAFLVEGDPTAPPRRLHVSTEDKLSDARMIPSPTPGRAKGGARDEVQIGSVGIKLCLIAAGEADLYINPAGKTKLWDSGPPGVILAEAGGLLTDVFGQPLSYRGELGHKQGLVASNRRLHEQALQRLAPLAAALRPERRTA